VGHLHLEKVRPGLPKELSKQALKQFPKLEASCILIAFLGYLANQGFAWAVDELAMKREAVIVQRSDSALAALALVVQKAIEATPELSARVPGWDQDRRLIEMYLGMILKRPQ
jgi:uncharacterized protein HemY